MARKKLFIGSSTEALKLAEDAKSILEAEFDVTVWNDSVWDTSVFKINQNFLSDLLRASLQFDYGLLLGTADDKVSYRGKDVLKPRDNVLFELGLFTGRLGISKCAFIIDKELDLLSDLKGISLARFDKTEPKSFLEAVSLVKDLFLGSSDGDINFFPSATLAAVYVENLIHPTCRYIIENGGFLLKDRTYKKCKIKVVIPERINEDVNLQFEKLKGKFSMENVSFKYAGRPRYISVDTQIKDDTLEFIDFPTVIAGINHAIANLLPHDFNKLSPDYDAILSRELQRFITTFKQLMLRHGFDSMVEVVKESDLK